MEDAQIVALYWQREEAAVAESDKKYGQYCRRIARNILENEADAEECVNDTWLKAWNAIPPQRPAKLSVFLGRITRNLALNRRERETAQKRGGGITAAVLEELEGCLPAPMGDPAEDMVIRETLDRFLAELPAETRQIFLQRYWYLCPVKEIAALHGMGESRVKMILLRARNQLRDLLEQEGITL